MLLLQDLQDDAKQQLTQLDDISECLSIMQLALQIQIEAFCDADLVWYSHVVTHDLVYNTLLMIVYVTQHTNVCH